MEWKDRIARLFRRKPEWEREHRRTDVPADTDHSLHGLLAMHTFLLDAYLEQHPDSKLRQPPMAEVQAAAHIIDRQFRAETFRELRHLAETSGRYTPSCYVVRLYDWDTDMGRLQEMRGRLDGPACPDDPQQVQQLRERIWKTENRMVREAERILEGDQEIPLRQTYIEKLDAELQTLGWLARFPERIDDNRINRQLLDKYRILPGISPAEQYGQVEKAFRELDERLVHMTGRQPYADDLFESLRQKGPKPEKHISGVRQKEIDSTRKEQPEQSATGWRIKR